MEIDLRRIDTVKDAVNKQLLPVDGPNAAFALVIRVKVQLLISRQEISTAPKVTLESNCTHEYLSFTEAPRWLKSG